MKKPGRIVPVILMILFLFPRCADTSIYYIPSDGKRIQTGLEVFCKKNVSRYRGRKAVLVTNHSGVDFNLRQNIHLLQEKGVVISMIMAPEHGLYGFQNEYDSNTSFNDEKLGVIIYNMHKLTGAEFAALSRQADVVIFDIQDMGMRCYTYITNLKFVMDALSGTGIELVVLDRPDPIGFLGTDGAYLEEDCVSRFISAFPAPFIYNMTIAEAAMYYRNEFARDVKLTVVPMKNYRRGLRYPQTQMPWVPPSPNLPTYDSSVVYAAVVQMEGVNISLGRGTAKPFEYIGAPWIDPYTFTEQLKSLGLKNFRFRPVRFMPTFSKYNGQVCGGAQIFYTGGEFSATEFAYRVIMLLMEKYPQAAWTQVNNIYDIDTLAGSKIFRACVDAREPYASFMKKISAAVRAFEKKRKKYILYPM